ncbi:hypothetical protein M9H77_24961 [Catharanthus roseus]|uniref:Uncharacterized protein n=1 Tax=Catharanthus roseus TaxID=4058 RepID=A0ACC0A9S2_CATRO|nr:hypothetical protein M9H77_24961 [Catharanthus roseus]
MRTGYYESNRDLSSFILYVPFFVRYLGIQKESKMIGSFLTRGLALVFGYAYPAYECFKTVELNKPDIEQLRFWCQYWILVAVLTICERVGDAFISWIPMYSEAKLAFFIYLWYPKTKGTTYVYDSFFRPLVSERETEIDRSLLELRTRAGDLLVLYWQKSFSYGQTRIFDILQYIASQSNPPPPPAQTQQQGARVRQPTAPTNRKKSTTVTQVEEPPSPASSSTSSSQHQDDTPEVVGPSEAPIVVSTCAVSNAQKQKPAQPNVETTKVSTSNEEVMEIDEVPPVNENVKTAPQDTETVIEEGIRVTRARSRRARVTTIR